VISPASPVADQPRESQSGRHLMAPKAAPAEGPPRTRTGRGINRVGAAPSSHICQARPSPLRRRRARSSTPAATAHSSSTASRSATAAACSLSRRRPWLGGALSTPRLARASGSAAASNRRHDAEAREDGGTLRPQARLHPGSSDPSPIDADVDSCGSSPCGSVRAPSAPSRGYGRQPGLANAIYLPWVQRVSGFASWPRGVGVRTLRAEARAA